MVQKSFAVSSKSATKRREPDSRIFGSLTFQWRHRPSRHVVFVGRVGGRVAAAAAGIGNKGPQTNSGTACAVTSDGNIRQQPIGAKTGTVTVMGSRGLEPEAA